MESNSSMAGKELELEESFSFSCHELNSALQSLYYPSSDDEDDESYIEIDLDSVPQSREFELRISFEFPRQIPAVDLSSPLSDPEMGICCDGRLASPMVEISSFEDADAIGAVQEGVKGGSAVNDYCRKSRQFVRRLRNDDLFGSRAPSKIANAVNNGIMKFFIKLRSGNVVSSIMSLIRSHYTVSLRSNRGNGNSRSSHESQRLMKPFCTWWAQMSNSKIIFHTRDAGLGNYNDYRKKNSKNEAVYNENSLHAAIAYCKRSPMDVMEFR